MSFDALNLLMSDFGGTMLSSLSLGNYACEMIIHVYHVTYVYIYYFLTIS